MLKVTIGVSRTKSTIPLTFLFALISTGTQKFVENMLNRYAKAGPEQKVALGLYFHNFLTGEGLLVLSLDYLYPIQNEAHNEGQVNVE